MCQIECFEIDVLFAGRVNAFKSYVIHPGRENGSAGLDGRFVCRILFGQIIVEIKALLREAGSWKG